MPVPPKNTVSQLSASLQNVRFKPEEREESDEEASSEDEIDDGDSSSDEEPVHKRYQTIKHKKVVYHYTLVPNRKKAPVSNSQGSQQQQ